MSKNYHQRSADRRRFHYIYKTTCLITGRYYIGMHSTDNLNDGYIGSGQRLWHSIRKHGKENHRAEIIEFLENREALVHREIVLVDKNLLKDPLCMNLVLGGKGDWGWGATSNEEKKAARIQKLREAWQRPGHRENFKAKTSGRVRSDEAKAKMRARWTPERLAAQAERLRSANEKKPKLDPKPYVPMSQRPGYIAPPDRATQSREAWAKHAADEARLAATKEAMAIAKRGKIWVHLESVVKLITADQEQSYLEQGWRRGTGNRQKIKEVSAETRAKLAEMARKQHERNRLHK